MSPPFNLLRARCRWTFACVLGAAATLTSCTAAQKPAPAPRPAPPVQSPSPALAPAPPPGLVPLPVSARFSEGAGFAITPAAAVLVPSGDPRLMFIGRFLARLLTTVGPLGPAVLEGGVTVQGGNITLAIGDAGTAGDEAYRLTVTPAGVTLVAPTPAGLFHGVQTLRQLLPPFLEYEAARPRPIVIPSVEIADHPRFAWRGAMLDVARHFFGVEDVKRYVDLLALHKMNRLHLHLADDQGWRIEIKSRPNLTAWGGRTEVGGGAGGFYTQEQYRDIVAYAHERFIEVIPEIDMPGHTNAALASYPELNCDGVAPALYTDIKVGFSSLCVADERTYAFIDDVVREIAALSPGAFFHVGGDEVKTLTEAEYARFIVRVHEIVRGHGKEMIGWDEIAAVELRPAPVVQHWRPGAALFSAVATGVRLIMSPGNRTYLDMQYDPATALGLSWAGRIEVRDAYEWDPATLLEGVTEPAILGVEAPIWSETLATMSDLESMAFPRLAAIAEIGWSPQSRRDWGDFRVRLGGQGPRWQALGVNFYRSPQVPWRP